MKIKAVIFDLDGTLLNTLDDIADSMNASLAKLGYPQHPIASYTRFVGDGMDTLSRRALPPEVSQDAAVVAACLAGMRAEYAVRWAVKTRLYPEMDDTLDALTKTGIALGVLSNKPDNFTQEMTLKLLGKWRFQAIAGAKPDVPKKPDPTSAILMLRNNGWLASEVLYVGDSGVDMETARGAGMVPVAATWGFRSEEELRAAGAKYFLRNPLEVLQVIARI